MDWSDSDSVGLCLHSADVDLVVHAAGPFQQAEKCNVLEAAINTKVPYPISSTINPCLFMFMKISPHMHAYWFLPFTFARA